MWEYVPLALMALAQVLTKSAWSVHPSVRSSTTVEVYMLTSNPWSGFFSSTGSGKAAAHERSEWAREQRISGDTSEEGVVAKGALKSSERERGRKEKGCRKGAIRMNS